MRCLREHIDALHRFNGVPGADEKGQIPGEGAGLAGDVDEDRRCKGEHIPHGLRLNAFPGRIEDDDVRLFLELAHLGLDVPGDKLAVGQAVGRGVGLGCLDRFGNQLDADNFFSERREDLADGPDATVQVEEHGLLRCTGRSLPDGVAHRGVEHLGAPGVGLEKGEGRDLEIDVENPVVDDAAAVKQAHRFRLGHVGDAVVEAVDHRHDLAFQL